MFVLLLLHSSGRERCPIQRAKLWSLPPVSLLFGQDYQRLAADIYPPHCDVYVILLDVGAWGSPGVLSDVSYYTVAGSCCSGKLELVLF